MEDGKNKILNVLAKFSGTEGEPKNEIELYILHSMWVMMLSEFEASIKSIAENYIDKIKKKDISDIHVCLLIKQFCSKSNDTLTIEKIISCYKKDPKDINYRNFTKDKVPKYKFSAVEKLFNSLGIFFTESERTLLLTLDSVASTRDAIAHGDIGVQITRKELELELDKLVSISRMLNSKLLR
ncbi:HEPN domain-containing protein [Nitrosomonas ureae]|uniref:RiboL-PSP-HEPN domain-containing protein n=1 Tax=Nitrosomonas ureae TaxID=44577 RepID=A0A2T5IRM6_9PROT|nr:HEPN domain-containing protein [Nitrosomonas ureae]PTQ86482.1 hypothetical protein C8R28_101058 [Nitrosomonas ureae]